MMICREIITAREHQNPQLFRTFHMEVYCFPDPEDPQQVHISVFLYIM